ncbi:3'-5' exonuclease [Rhizobium sp. 1399]|uniref:3'-5' exonuclease n=1 Tax=Rhizobium sp. 1399 TaxID=2817758 RepID=UPI00285C4053|nr:3'-5' exonuclease [Rhizobium sp. 1399]MDR6670151.1 DNA polymerase-3 subunit epsilon [Rhizobium sp. 1399]
MTQQFDFFVSEQTGPVGPPGSAKPERRPPDAAREGEMIRHLQATGRYRVLTKIEPRPVAVIPRPEFLLRGVILDVETTGLNHRSDEIIEIGAIAFTFGPSGTIGDVTEIYSGLQQPMNPIPAEITQLTGITDEMVAGKMIDTGTLRALVEPADLIVAHNAGFDRPFCEAFSPLFSGKAWACSASEIDWMARGMEGTKLGYLITQSGYFHEAHRALDDCFALFELLAARPDVPRGAPFAELYAASRRSFARIFAEHSPFDMKDQLKARGYRWADGSDGQPKSWWIDVAEDSLEDELKYLRAEIYCWDEADPLVSRLTAFERFRA